LLKFFADSLEIEFGGMMLKSFIRTVVWSIVTVFAFTYPVTAQHSNKESSEADRAIEASTVLTEIMNIPESSIPEELMGRAHGIAVIPHVVKGAFGIVSSTSTGPACRMTTEEV
jgi:hypothetical protein